MSFQWEPFLRRQRIEYVVSGPNVARGYIAVKCPFCGAADPSEHMSISLRGTHWRCWRNPHAHSGGSPVYLVQALLRCTHAEAVALVGLADTGRAAPDHSELVGVIDQIRPSAEAGGDEALTFPREFKSLLSGSPMAVPFWNYLRARGYSDADIQWLGETYNLQYATRGDFSWRVIVPVTDRGGGVVTWTGRSIRLDAVPKYKTLSVRSGLARVSTSRTLLGLHRLYRAPSPRALILCEGPFDALRLTVTGHELGVWSTCLFGLSLDRDQIEELSDLCRRFDRMYLMLDDGARMSQMRMLQSLSLFGVQPLGLPDGYSDPGELTSQAVVSLCLDVLGRL